MAEASPFGAAVARLRQERGWTQEQVARKVGVSVSYIGQLESGHAGQRPKRDLVLKVAGAFETDPGPLLEAAGLPPPERSPQQLRDTYERVVRADSLLRSDQKRVLIDLYRTMTGRAPQEP